MTVERILQANDSTTVVTAVTTVEIVLGDSSDSRTVETVVTVEI